MKLFVGIALLIIQAAVNTAILAIFFNHKTNKIMDTIQSRFNAVMDRIDKGTTAVANELKSLKEAIAGNGLSAEAEAAVLARLDAAATTLEAVGKDVPEEEEGKGDGEGEA